VVGRIFDSSAWLCAIDMNSCRSVRLKAQVSTTCWPCVLTSRRRSPCARRTALPLRAGTMVRSATGYLRGVDQREKLPTSKQHSEALCDACVPHHEADLPQCNQEQPNTRSGPAESAAGRAKFDAHAHQKNGPAGTGGTR